MWEFLTLVRKTVLVRAQVKVHIQQKQQTWQQLKTHHSQEEKLDTRNALESFQNVSLQRIRIQNIM